MVYNKHDSTELTEMMINVPTSITRQQMFEPLVNSIIDKFFTVNIPRAAQNLY